MFPSECREFPLAPCIAGKKNLQLANLFCWNRARPWHDPELVFFLVGLRTYQHPGISPGHICAGRFFFLHLLISRQAPWSYVLIRVDQLDTFYFPSKPVGHILLIFTASLTHALILISAGPFLIPMDHLDTCSYPDKLVGHKFLYR